jgi:hypothetical protein
VPDFVTLGEIIEDCRIEKTVGVREEADAHAWRFIARFESAFGRNRYP